MTMIIFAIFLIENVKNKVYQYIYCLYQESQNKSAAPSLLPGKNVTNSCFTDYEHILSVRIVGKGLFMNTYTL